MVHIPRKSYPTAWSRPNIVKDLVAGGMEPAMADNIADTLNKINMKQATDERLNYQAIEGMETGGKPYATVVVAASNSYAADAAHADYVCTGTADQDVINAALAFVGGGGRVVLLEGTYRPVDTININSDKVSLVGMGRSTIIDWNKTTDRCVLVNADYCHVADLSVYSDTTLALSYGVELAGDHNVVHNVTVEGLDFGFHNTGGDRNTFSLCRAINITDTAIRDSGDNTVIIGCSVFSNGATNQGIVCNSSVCTVVSGCLVQGCANEGIALQSGNGHTVSGCIVQGCDVGIYIESPATSVTGNLIYDCGGWGIKLDGFSGVCTGNIVYSTLSQTGDGIWAASDGSVVIVGNRVHIEGVGIRLDVEDCLVQDNSLYLDGSGSTDDGIVSSSGLGTGITIRGNRISGPGRYGIIMADAKCPSVTDNHIYGSGCHGIYMQDNCKHPIVANNTVLASNQSAGAYDGIRLDSPAVGDSLDDAFVTGNMVRHLGLTNKAAYGIRIGPTNVNNAFVVGNDLKDSGSTAPLLDGGTASVLTYPAHATYGDNRS